MPRKPLRHDRTTVLAAVFACSLVTLGGTVLRAATGGVGVTVVSITTPPTIVALSSPDADGTYSSPGSLSITVHFDQNVFVDTTGGTPVLVLESGGTAFYASGSGTNVLTFAYAIGGDDASDDLDAASATALELRGGTIANRGPTDADLTVPVFPDDGALASQKDLAIEPLDEEPEDDGESSSSAPTHPAPADNADVPPRPQAGPRTAVCPPAIAQDVYADIPADSWYESGVRFALCRRYLDETKDRFRPADAILRAEVAKLTNLANGTGTVVLRGIFGDVPSGEWYAIHMVRAAEEGWLRGDDDCFAREDAFCTARPADPITRAEAAAVLIRAFGYDVQAGTATFDDVPEDAWYAGIVATAERLCLLRGDEGTRSVRPDDPVNRAEFVTMLHRMAVPGPCTRN